MKGRKAMRDMRAPTIVWTIKPSRNEDVFDDSTSPSNTSTERRDESEYKYDM